MNIGIVTVWHDRGAAYVSKAYFQALSRNHKVFIYSRGGEYSAKGDLNWEGENVTWGKRVHYGIPTFIVWKDFKKWLTSNNLHLIIFNEQQSYDVILRCVNLGIKIGAYIDYYTKETVPFFGLYDFLICNTQRHYSVFKNHPQCIFVPWGTDCDLFSRSLLKIPGEEVIFFHSCGMNPWRKGTDILITAYKKVNGKSKLIIHSQIPIKDERILNLIENDPRITLLIKTVAPPGLYHLGDVYVYPTRLEGIGLTIAEALASGLPVITVDNPPMNEFVVDGVNGKLIPARHFRQRSDKYYWNECFCDEQLLAQAMQFYVDHKNYIKDFKLKAREYAVKNLDWKTNSEKLSESLANTRILSKSLNLKGKTIIYEYLRYPKLMLSAFIRKFS